ncbi:hypothetical protein COR50_03740 [Chitinophaga caeni]|uniref:Uncharacterized protein n=1 Tax=Chitinophaga caeni TaxID=2029983 RepID=A0A291QR14_9BACT|nr:hypothetical protein COR50_03740 [Chitinophaga caeni]
MIQFMAAFFVPMDGNEVRALNPQVFETPLRFLNACQNAQKHWLLAGSSFQARTNAQLRTHKIVLKTKPRGKYSLHHTHPFVGVQILLTR